MAVANPFCIEGINSLGILPPLTSSTNWRPLPSKLSSAGSTRTMISANLPRPPVCFLYTSRNSTGLVIASLYETWGRPWLHSTLNSRFRRSIIISKWSSPIPLITVWPVSSSVLTVKVGSSSANFCKPRLSLSISFWVLGSTAIPITGSGKSMASSTIGASSAQSVSPVRISLKPTPAPISPQPITSLGFCLLECIWNKRDTRSFFPERELRT